MHVRADVLDAGLAGRAAVESEEGWRRHGVDLPASRHRVADFHVFNHTAGQRRYLLGRVGIPVVIAVRAAPTILARLEKASECGGGSG